MIETIKYATISNIYVKELIFYEGQNEKELKEFCYKYGFSYIPDSDRKTIYKLINDEFVKVPLTDDLVCNPFDRLFDLETLNKFESGNHDEVLFVKENDLIKGVVHIVDYNNDFLNIEFYKASYRFERMLRDFLDKSGESNETLIKWIEEKVQDSDHWSRRYDDLMPKNNMKRAKLERKRKDLKPFQSFYLNDLLYFATSKDLVSENFKKSVEAIKAVRNWVAHDKDLAYKSTEVGKPLYKIEELRNFVINANQFFQCYEELEFKSI